jgi:hypothetical protein
MIAERLDQISTLYQGSHQPDGQMCVMEAAAYVAGEPWSDHPACVSPVIGAFLRSWNDALPDDATRTRLLRPLIEPILGTHCDVATESRLAWMCVDWLARVQAPAWMRLTSALCPYTEGLADLPEITIDSWPSARPRVTAAWVAARAAAWDGAGIAARAAAWAAAGDAAGVAAGAAARAAAWVAAGVAAGAAAGAAAGDAARVAAGVAAGAAARAAAWAAARAAARAALASTVATLQEEAVALVLRMCAVAKGETYGR